MLTKVYGSTEEGTDTSAWEDPGRLHQDMTLAMGFKEWLRVHQAGAEMGETGVRQNIAGGWNSM